MMALPMLRPRAVVLLAVAWCLAASTAVSHAQEDCSFTVKQRTYHLADLRGDPSSYHEVDNQRLKVEADVTLCQGLGVSGCQGAVVCIRKLDGSNPTPAGDPSNGTFELVDPTDPDFGARLIYPPAQGQTLGVHFVFTCGVGVGEPVLMERFDEDASDHGYAYYVVQWATDEMCSGAPPAKQENCQATDTATGTEYDLSALVRNKNNWVAVDVLESNKHHYEINVCRSLVITDEIKGTTCETNEGTAICKSDVQPDGTHTHSMSLGWSAKPIFRAGKLSIETSFGDECPAGFKSDAVIDFICDVNAGSGHPTLREVTDQCLYVFAWRSSVACPVKDETGNNCKVTDKATGKTYDLTSLNLNKKPYTIAADDYTYEFNVCGDIPAGGHHDCVATGACQIPKDGSHVYNLGQANPTLTYSRETLTLEYTGGDPCGGQRRKTIITFHCTDGDDKYEVVESTPCVYEIEFFTAAACGLDSDLLECVVTDDQTGEQYDLSSLTRTGGSNWRMAKDSHTTDEIELNVCAPLVYSGDTAACPADAAVCGISGIPNRPANSHLGLPADPVVRDGILTIDFPAKDGQCGATTLLLHCSDTQDAPQHLMTSDDGCSVTLQWNTPAACPLNAASGQNCMVTDPDTTVDGGEDGSTYFVSLCSPLDRTATCAHGDNAACVSHKTESHGIGQANDVLHILDGTLFAKYTMGVSCEDGNELSSTVILFECDPSYTGDEDNALYFSRRDQDSCTFEFVWKTRLACDAPTFECIVEDDDGNVYDLSPLAKPQSNWLATGSDGASFYEVNICRTINDNVGSSCLRSRDAACQRTPSGSYALGKPAAPKANWKALDTRDDTTYEYELNVCHNLIRPVDNDPTDKCRGAAACQTKPGDTSFPNYPIGLLDSPPSLVRGNIELTYTMDSLAPDNCGSNRRKATITFSCLPGTLGSPMFDYEDETCHYYFVWETSAACSTWTTVGSQCEVTDPISLLTFNLRNWASETGVIEIDVPDSTAQLLIAVCGVVPNCDGAGACLISEKGDRINIGSTSQALTFADNELRLTYNNGAKCLEDSSANMTTILTFVCPDDIRANTTQYRVYDCNTYVIIPTDRACRRRREASCVVTDPDTGAAYDLSPLEKAAESHSNWIVDVKDKKHKFEYILNVCHSLNEQVPPTGCDETAGVCQIEGDNRYNLGGVASPSIENGTLVIEYTNGDSDRCPWGKYRRTRIEFTCDETAGLGQPVYVSEDDDLCEYMFTWASSAACPVRAPSVGDSCAVTDPATDTTFDLNDIDASSLTATDDMASYKFGLCSALGGGCAGDADSGLCMTRNGGSHVSLGKANGHLMVREGLVYLVYRNGSDCPYSPHTPYSAEIRFVCRPCEPDELIPQSVQGVCRTSFTFFTANSGLCGDIKGNCTSPNGRSSKHGANTGAVAAGVLIPLLLVGGGAAFYFLYWRRRSRQVAFMPMSVVSSHFDNNDAFDEDADDDDPLDL
ncbi:hypothetical protein PTSG_09952 [Salpingoeca rosetta]|uniref:MRH domain-containing protein n=1 Tax=Salpingoeca rosetta (strain ATCC 50818 / BSB-021) TaxID=946362 RepID=F2UNM6_SALR5|nr:uncharacterized protein PTSG_09952 [Salpingoeca rosetta]EGD79231.1 hypothetical protein PTSG_09952 [Salpingoeca rosetta]|eukprot:XP_004989316.1 hypothetical protein PTSG_09952 [Salpingoeca rosetta]